MRWPPTYSNSDGLHRANVYKGTQKSSNFKVLVLRVRYNAGFTWPHYPSLEYCPIVTVYTRKHDVS